MSINERMNAQARQIRDKLIDDTARILTNTAEGYEREGDAIRTPVEGIRAYIDYSTNRTFWIHLEDVFVCLLSEDEPLEVVAEEAARTIDGVIKEEEPFPLKVGFLSDHFPDKT